MNKVQKEVIKELKGVSKRQGHSPARREIPKLARKCYAYFGLFNKAKEKAGLSVVKRTCDPLPKRAYKFTKELAKIVSYITFDGHLYKDLKGFYFSSKSIKHLKEFNKLIVRQFGIKPYYKLNTAGTKKQTHKVMLFNTKITKFLNEISVPRGDKIINPFNVPKWIMYNKDFAKEYLKIAFFCEGSWKEYDRNNPRIKFNINKSKNLINNGVLFMREIKNLLIMFGIETTPIGIYKGNLRKDGNITKELRIRILTKDNNKFIKQIGWYK